MVVLEMRRIKRTTPMKEIRMIPLIQTPYHERILPAPGVNGWKRSAAWSHWEEWLHDDALRVYRYLRQTAVGEQRPVRVYDIRKQMHIGHSRFRDHLFTLEQLGFIKCRWGKLMPITITVRDVPDVPEAVQRQVKNLPSGVKLDVSQTDINRFLAYWCEKYEQHRREPYHVVRGRDSKLVHDLLETFGLDALKRLCWYLLAKGVGSEVVRYDEVSIPTFALHINRIVMEKKTDEQPSPRTS